LPSIIRHIKRLSQALSVENGLTNDTKKYLQMRGAKLNDHEKCVLIINEIFTTQHVEYSNSKFYGTEDGELTKTMLEFMIKSEGGKYSDMVALCQISKLDSKIIWENYMKVLKSLTKCGFDVVSSSADNHTINQKFFLKELCLGEVKPFMKRPFKEGSKNSPF